MPTQRRPIYHDLSQSIEAGMTTFPGDPAVAVSPAATVAADGFSVHELCCGTHTGTHIDAPSHTEPDGSDIDDIDVGEYVFDARLVDVGPCTPREAIGRDRFPERIDEGVDLVVIRTGWDAMWNTDDYLNHPYLTADAARWLRDAECGIGIDALNPDPTPIGNTDTSGSEIDSDVSSDEIDSDVSTGEIDNEPNGFPVHHILLGANLPIIENLADLDGLPERFTLYAFPLPVTDSDGAPIRAVAAV